MKKILLLLIFLLSTLVINAQFQVIGVGVTANDNTGDPLRTMGIKTNANFSMVQDSFNAALDADDYYWQKTDTSYTHKQVVTYDQLMNFQGGGSGVSKDKLQFIIGTTTGAPANGDTILTHTGLIGKEIDFFRGTTADLSKQYFNTTATNGKTGYRFNSTTGTITVRPAFSTGDRCLVEGWNPLNVNWLAFSGNTSSLITGLRAGFKLDEQTGTQANDVLSTYPGVTNATVGQTGVRGYAETFNGTDDFINLGTTVGDVGTNDFSVSGWIYLTAWASNYNSAGIFGNWGDSPYFYCGVYTETGDPNDHKIRAVVNFAGTNQNIYSNSAISLNTWTHIALVADRSGLLTMYIGGVAQTGTLDISTHSAVDVTNNNTFAIGRVGSTLSNHYFTGSIDDVFIWTKALTSGEVTEAMNKTHPW